MKNVHYHHGDLRNQLIETGILLITENGMNRFSLRKVAAKCGVSHAAPYSHFKDIDELIHTMGKHVTKKFMEKLTASIEGQDDNRIAVLLLGSAYISFFQENPHYFQFLFDHSKIKVDLDQNTNDDYPPFTFFRETAYKMFKDLGLALEDYQNNLIALWSLVHGIASLLTNNGIHYSGDWNKVLTENIMMGGMNRESNYT